MFNDYREEAWMSYKQTALSDATFIQTSPIDTYIQIVKFIGVWEWMQTCYEKEESGDEQSGKIAKKINESLMRALVNYCGEKFFKLLHGDDVIKMKYFLRKSSQEKDINIFLARVLLVYLHNKKLYEQLGESFQGLTGDFIKKFSVTKTGTEEAFREEIKNRMKEIFESKSKHELDYKWMSIGNFDQRIYTNEAEKYFVNTIDRMLSIYGVDNDLFDAKYPISKKDWELICYFLVSSNNEVQKFENLWIRMLLLAQLLGKSYSDARKLFFESNEEFIELERKSFEYNQKEIKTLEKKYLKELEKKDFEIERLKKEYRSNLERDVLKKEKELERMQELLENAYKKEIEEEILLQKREEQIFEEFIDDKEITLVGGFPKLNQRIKDYFPKARFENNPVRAKGEVFLLTRYMSHTEQNAFNASHLQFQRIDGLGVNQIAHEIKRHLNE